jgi:hypothetical protein
VFSKSQFPSRFIVPEEQPKNKKIKKNKKKKDRGENEENSVLEAYSNIHCIYEEGGD